MTRALPGVGVGLLLLFVGPAVALVLLSIDAPSVSTILVASLTAAAAASIFVYGFRASPFYEPESQTPPIAGGGDGPLKAPEPEAPVQQPVDPERRVFRPIRLTKRRTRRRRSFTRVDWHPPIKRDAITPATFQTDEREQGQAWGDVATLVDEIASVLEKDLELIQLRRQGTLGPG
jgi:hypothetical protein